MNTSRSWNQPANCQFKLGPLLMGGGRGGGGVEPLQARNKLIFIGQAGILSKILC